MDDPAKKGPGATPTAAAPAMAETAEADEFAALPRSRTRHPLLALGAAVLALFLIAKMRADLSYFLSPRTSEELGDARALLTSERGRAVLAEGTNRLVRVRGVPDRESALQVDTKGSWTFTQFFKILGTDGRLFVHRREDPLPAFRAEADVFEGRLLRFSDLSFEDAIRAYFSGHVSATHFFAPAALASAVQPPVDKPITLKDKAGDSVTLGPNDLLAIVVRHQGEVEVGLPSSRFQHPETARAALVERGATVVATLPPTADRHVFKIIVAPAERDRVLNAIGDIDWRVGIRQVRETIKVRLSDLVAAAGGLAVARPGVGARSPLSGPRLLENIDSIRTLAPVQIPQDAYLIVEGESPREHLPEVAIALVLLVFASVNLVGLGKGLRR